MTISADERPASLEESSPLQSAVLEELGWAVNYTTWLCELTGKWLGDNPLEIGSGHGQAAERWAADGITITCSEADPERLEVLKAKFADHDGVTVRELKVPIRESADHSAVVALNVLEHIEDDVEALRDFARLVRPGGRIVLVVPAFELAMSDFDRAIGHYRRYRIATMRKAFVDAGLKPVDIRYLNSVGLLGWIVLVRLLKGRPRNGFPLRVFDRVVLPVIKAIEKRVRPPFGQSVLGVAEKPVAE